MVFAISVGAMKVAGVGIVFILLPFIWIFRFTDQKRMILDILQEENKWMCCERLLQASGGRINFRSIKILLSYLEKRGKIISRGMIDPASDSVVSEYYFASRKPARVR